jgi:hypothetical protein
VTQAVLNTEADIGLTYSRTAERDIEVQHRQVSPVIAIMRPDHPLARHASVTLAQMHPYPVALPERDNTVRQLFDIGCSQRQLVFDPVLVSNHFETLTHFVPARGSPRRCDAGGAQHRSRHWTHLQPHGRT